MTIIKTECYWHKYDQYTAFLHTYDDGTLMLEYTLEFDDGRMPCYIKKRIKKIDTTRAFEFMCLLEEYDQKTKRPKKTKSVHKDSGI